MWLRRIVACVKAGCECISVSLCLSLSLTAGRAMTAEARVAVAKRATLVMTSLSVLSSPSWELARTTTALLRLLDAEPRLARRSAVRLESWAVNCVDAMEAITLNNCLSTTAALLSVEMRACACAYVASMMGGGGDRKSR